MIATNGAIARFLAERRFPVMRRVVRSPERWQRIVDLATVRRTLPPMPDSSALHEFLIRRRAADPLRFDLALGHQAARSRVRSQLPGQEVQGHFGLAVTDYTHSTAPNRRYPDLVTQRLVKSALAAQPVPYARPALEALAAIALKEDDAERSSVCYARRPRHAPRPPYRRRVRWVVTGASPKDLGAHLRSAGRGSRRAGRGGPRCR